MIKIYYDKYDVLMEGHSTVDVCAAVSSITYTSINNFLGYNENCVDVNDDGKRMLIHLNSYDKFIDIIKKVMINMYKDVVEQVPTGEIEVIEVKDWKEMFKDEIQCDYTEL